MYITIAKCDVETFADGHHYYGSLLRRKIDVNTRYSLSPFIFLSIFFFVVELNSIRDMMVIW